MANKFGYSGNLGYNSLRVSRNVTCCCPKGEPGEVAKGDKGKKGEKGDIGLKGDKGNIFNTPGDSYANYVYRDETAYQKNGK